MEDVLDEKKDISGTMAGIRIGSINQLIPPYRVAFLVVIVVFWLCKMVTFGEAWVKGIWEVSVLALQIL